MRQSRIFLVGVLLVACAARTVVLGVWPENLNDDRDAYLSLAQGITEGRGYSILGRRVPTAYRPPLYPVLLAVTGLDDSPWGRGLLHMLLGVGTVWCTYVLGRRLALGDRLALFAAALVAIDPLLLRYTTFPMTETLATFLTMVLLLAAISPSGLRQRLLTGVLFGLGVLCRPTLWVFGGLMSLRWLIHRVQSRRETKTDAYTENERSVPWVTLAAALLTVSPWVVRNMLVMGHPIVMTTHGGYTLLLGNNPAFFREVASQPWGTVWDGSVGEGQTKWVASLTREIKAAGLRSETARDRWMTRRAVAHILADPVAFLRACQLRFFRFWSVMPSGGGADAHPPALRMSLAVFYGGTFLLATVGLVRILVGDRRNRIKWMPAILMLAAFVGVHLVYWSNARMRSPVVPVVALLAARGLSRPSAVEGK